MTSGSLAPNAVDLTECCSNLFTLADINGLKWCKYTGNPCSLDNPLDDPVLVSFASALENNVLCSWRHLPPYTSQKLKQGITCPESAKELWLFWYGDDPRTINIVDKHLKESDHGSWESVFPNEAKVLLFKALHNTLERHLLSRDYVRLGKWFVSLDKRSQSEGRAQLFFSFAFCLQGESKICMTVDVKQLPGVRHLVPNDLTKATAVQGDFKVILGPYGVSANLTGHSYQLNGVGVSKLVDEWKRFYPLHVVDDWTNVPEGIEHDVPVVVGVMVGDNFVKYPSHYVLVALEDENQPGGSCETSFTPSSLNSPLFPMTPPASPFPPKATDKTKSRRASTAAKERQQTEQERSDTAKVADGKMTACELINETWKDITATKSTNKSSSVSSAQSKSFSSNYKTDQEPLWNFKEPLTRKSCSCTSSSNISRSRVPTPARSPFGINRPTPSPGSQNNQSTLASKLKKDKEKKPILPFHQRPLPTKFRQLGPASKGLPTCNVTTGVVDQNRQPNSHHQNEAPSKTVPTTKPTESTDGKDRLKAESFVPLIIDNDSINNNNTNEAYLKVPPIPTRLLDKELSDRDRKLSTTNDDLYHGLLLQSKKKQDIWKCYDVFMGDAKLKPRLPEDVLDLRDSQRIPLTTESVVSIPEDSGEVFTIETIETENYQNKRPANEIVNKDAIPAKRRRRSSSTSLPGSARLKTENTGGGKSRSSRSNSSSKSQFPTPSPEPTSAGSESHEKDSSLLSAAFPSSNGKASGNSSGGSAASSPASVAPVTSSKTNRGKNRRASRKSRDGSKGKDTIVSVKQEAVEPIAPLAKPPTPKGSVSLRTEKDLQVTLSDLDKLFDSPDEDEEESKTQRQTAMCTDDLSPPVSQGNDDSNFKTKSTVNTGPGVVSHADLVRMFPTPPSLENHPHSPSTSSVGDHYYAANPPVSCAPTPPEYGGHSGMGYGDVVKNLREERNDILAELRELPSVFEVPTHQEFLSSSSSFSPVKCLPSSRLPLLYVAENTKYTPFSLAKSTKGESTSLTEVVALNVRRSSSRSITISDFGQASLSSPLNTLTLKTGIPSPFEKDSGVERPRSKYTPHGEKNCNLLNINLFLSDSYLNYLSDTSLDCTNTCVCLVGDHKLAVRHLTMGKEPIGFARNGEVCSCGLGIFEREKLRKQEGLFSADIPSAGSCMDDIGVSLDERYFETLAKSTTNSVVPKEKESVTRETCNVKSFETMEIFGTSNSATLVECLLDQFSSPLSAAATSEKLAVTGVDDEATASPHWLKSATYAESFSKNAVEFLFDLKPVIQDSLNKAIHWKPWEQFSSVQGPLSLKQVCQVNSKGSLSATDPARIPRVVVGHDSDWLSMCPLALQYWEKLLLEPYTSSRDVAYVVLAPDNDSTVANVRCYFKELSSMYQTCLLGRHVPVTRVSSSSKGLRDGIMRIGQTSSTKYGKNAVSTWFSKYDNTADGPRLKLFAQVCRYELGPLLEKLARERQLLNQDKIEDGSSKSQTDVTSSSATSDNEVTGLHEEDPGPPSIVVYIVNPFDEAENRRVRRDSYFALLRGFSEMAASLSDKVRGRLVLEIVPLRQVTQVDAYQKTKGSHVSFVKLLKTTAFSVFSRCRLVLQYPYMTRTHTGFWATANQHASHKNRPSEKSRTRVYSPAYILATPTKLIHNVDTVETPTDLALHKESSNLLFCCYGLSQDHRWLLASCTNDTGLVMETFVTVVEPLGTSSTQRRSRLRIKALRRLWEFCQSVTSSMVAQWRLVIGKLSRFSRNELRDWDEIIRKHSSSESSETCEACSSLQSHSRFQSVSVVSLHNELCLRIHLAKVSTPFSSYQEPNAAIVESVDRPRISTTFIVINIESSQSSHLSQLGGMGELDGRGDLVDTDLMMTEPPTEDDDEIPMMPLFGSIANIFPATKPHLQDIRTASPHERPSSAPMLTDPVSSPFVPISLQSPHQSQSAGSDDQSNGDKNLGFPLAHGRVFTTAPLGPVFKQFSPDKDFDRSGPVVLKASLLAHHVEDSGRHGNHVLSSTVHTSVLRYILEHYDALSWLSVDSVSKDRTSCLPIHYTALSQMTHAFNGLIS